MKTPLFKLDREEKIILIMFILTAIILGLFPPWIYIFDGEGISSEKPAGYIFLFISPPAESRNPRYGISIDYGRLFLQWAILFGICASIIYFNRLNLFNKPIPKSELRTKVAIKYLSSLGYKIQRKELVEAQKWIDEVSKRGGPKPQKANKTK